MTRPAVVVVSAQGPLTPHIAEVSERILGPASSYEIVHLGDVDAASRPERVAALLASADAVVAAPWHDWGLGGTPGEVWDAAAAAGLRVLSGTFDNRYEALFGHPLDDAHRRGIRVLDTSRSMTPTVAEWCLAVILGSLRDIPNQVALVRGGGWTTEPVDEADFVCRDLTGARVSLAGFGVINRRLAELLAPFDCDVQAYDPFVPDDVLAAHGAHRASSLPELAARADVFVIGIPPSPATLRVIDASVIDALPAGAHLVLPTRMQVVDQDALWPAVAEGRIRAAIDVFDPEPPPADAWFRTHPNVLPTPHLAGNLRYCHVRCFTTACEEAVRVLAGEPSRYEMTTVDAELYAGRPERVVVDAAAGKDASTGAGSVPPPRTEETRHG